MSNGRNHLQHLITLKDRETFLEISWMFFFQSKDLSMYTPIYLMFSATSTGALQISRTSVTVWSFITACLCLVEMSSDWSLATFRDGLFPLSQRWFIPLEPKM